MVLIHWIGQPIRATEQNLLLISCNICILKEGHTAWDQFSIPSRIPSLKCGFGFPYLSSCSLVSMPRLILSVSSMWLPDVNFWTLNMIWECSEVQLWASCHCLHSKQRTEEQRQGKGFSSMPPCPLQPDRCAVPSSLTFLRFHIRSLPSYQHGKCRWPFWFEFNPHQALWKTRHGVCF